MGCKIVDLSEDSTVSPSFNDALLFTTMCIIGIPVEVQVKDGSIYFGIFHTASVEKDYGIVLKKARMTKKGKNDGNLEIGVVIDTLVVLSGDLVQVVAKGVIIQADGTVGSVAEDDIGTVNESEEVSPKCNKGDLKISTVDTTRISQIRSLDLNENKSAYDFINTNSGDDFFGKAEEALGMSIEALPLKSMVNIANGNADSMHHAKIAEVSTVSDYAGQIGRERSQGEKDQFDQDCEAHKQDTINKVRSSSSSEVDIFHTRLKSVDGKNLGISSNNFPNGACAIPDPSFVRPDTQDCERPASTDFPSDVSTSSTSGVDVRSQSCSTSLASSTSMVLPRSLAFNANTKEFKLNPGAKTFSPSFAIPRATLPAVPVASIAYIPNSSPLVPVAGVQSEIGVSSFAPRSSLPVKLVQYNNSVVGNGGSGSQYSQPIDGHVGSRPQPVRYAGQYPIQAGTAYLHPNSQPVMVGRLGQLLYVHPVSHDVVQGVAAFSQVSTRPLLTPHQAHLPKHQGNGTAPALQLYMAPPSLMAGGQHPFAVPTDIQLSESPFPTIRPVPVHGVNGLFRSKFP